jgi:glycoprotein-N-acetylgalactosamine 3-beta-galactosyltransferase
MLSRKFAIIIILLFVFYVCINQFTSYTQITSYKKNDIKSVRICCLILTAPKYLNTRARAVNLTWAPRCDKYLFISEYSNNTYHLPIAPIKNLKSGYKHLTQKTTLAFYYAYENLIDQFDWFVKADDDTYIIVENLRNFLQEHNSSQGITFGYNYKVCLKDKIISIIMTYVLSD